MFIVCFLCAKSCFLLFARSNNILLFFFLVSYSSSSFVDCYLKCELFTPHTKLNWRHERNTNCVIRSSWATYTNTFMHINTITHWTAYTNIIGHRNQLIAKVVVRFSFCFWYGAFCFRYMEILSFGLFNFWRFVRCNVDWGHVFVFYYLR